MNNDSDPNSTSIPMPAAAAAVQPSASSLGPIAAEESNFGLGIVGGLLAAVAGAIVWAVITVNTKFQIGFMAVGVGFLVAWAVRTLGKGHTPLFGYMGAAFALLGCLLGNVLTACGFVAAESSESAVSVALKVLSHPAVIPGLLQATFNPMDLLFYGIAVYEGYRFARRPGGA